MPPPKSPLERLSSHARRAATSRRSSNDESSKSKKHGGVKTPQSPAGKPKDFMADSTSDARETSASTVEDTGTRRSLAGEPSDHSTRRLSDRGIAQRYDVQQSDTSEEDVAQSEARPRESRSEARGTSSAEEVERLRAAMNAQIQLNQHRERLAGQLGDKGSRGSVGAVVAGIKTRVSPIREEVTSPSLEEAFSSPLPTGLQTASTESAKTVRGGDISGPMSARTPSYPFPPMRTPSGYSGHRPFTALSPTVTPANFAGGRFDSGTHDQVLSGSVTPASTLRFQPSVSDRPPDDPNFDTPNLYELSLLLGSEPGLDAWWTTLVQIMRTMYHAHRVTLSVPADSTDIENVPWGQKATFNVQEEDELSLTYLPRGSSLVPSSVGTGETSHSEDTNTPEDLPSIASPAPSTLRPGLLSRHSFTAYEDTKREPMIPLQQTSKPSGASGVSLSRPSPLARAKSYLSSRPDLPPRTATLQNAQLSLQSLQDHMAYEDSRASAAWENPETATREIRGQMFSVLQALDYEAEPLIDNKGVLRVLERGKVIALTRDYPYVDSQGDENSSGSKNSQQSTKAKDGVSTKAPKPKPPDMGSRISSFFGPKSKRQNRSSRTLASEMGKMIPGSGRAPDDVEISPLPRYEEYEQAPPSPWSQSPAPSPAVRAETSENPFFMNSPVDEESFNPQSAPQNYTDMPQPETIGVDRSWTVLHIPLIHPLLSKPVQTFRLDTAAMESKTGRRNPPGIDKRDPGLSKSKQDRIEKATPIAILSMLTPVIPYPSNLRHSLGHLAPHLATSFSLCRHYSHLETEIAGLSRKRPQVSGFGAVAPGGRPSGDAVHLGANTYSPVDECGPQTSAAGSITSPSDYSNLSRSTAGSPTGTPSWDPGNVGMNMDKRSSVGSPGYATGESYFTSRARPGLGRVDTGSASSITGARRTSKESSPQDYRLQKGSRSTDDSALSLEMPVNDPPEAITKVDFEQNNTRSSNSTPKQEPRPHHLPSEASPETKELRDASPPRRSFEASSSPRRQAIRTASGQGQSKSERLHTQLHSYGADFGATFQSLPTTSTTAVKAPTAAKSHSRSGSLSVPVDYMPPPSDRVKGIMLDSLPLHIFIALPPTGEMVWVNSRYLTYRGQSVKDLHEDPWASIHEEEREEYLSSWSHAIRTGEQFSMQVRLRRFDGTYRWFYTRAVGLRDSRGVIVQWYGTHMDIHDQHIAEVKAARQEEIEASEAKHKQLANLIPQIIFSATEDKGVTFANQQWLSFTGQDFDAALGLGFMDHVHPEDLAKCHIPVAHPPTPLQPRPRKAAENIRHKSEISSGHSSAKSEALSEAPTEITIKVDQLSLSRTNSSSNGSVYDTQAADLSELMKAGVVKVEIDSNGRTSYSTEVRLRSKSGEYRWHLVRCVEVDNINLGSGDGSWFGACADINDHKLLEMKLKEAMDSKGKFLSNMSHEIRTPLIGISGMTSFLQDTPLNDEQIDYCNTIASSAEGLLNIINDILDLAKADAGMMRLSYDWFHARSLVEEVNEMVSTIAITKHLEVNYVVDVDVPEMIKGDRFRIRQVLLNVIGNAIKFTTVGEVFSRCRVLSDETAAAAQNEVVLEFSILDTGRGFTQEEAEVIFKPFSQIDASSTRTHGGTGLGLVISRQLVELHGGKMEGTAVPGKGSTFTFTAKFGLPTLEDHPEPPTPALSKISSAQSSTITIVTDDIPARPKPSNFAAALSQKLVQSPNDSPRTESSGDSATILSSGSSDPSIHSTISLGTQRSSGSSIAQSLSHFNEAARAGAGDLAGMKLAIPERQASLPRTASSSPPITPTPTSVAKEHAKPSASRTIAPTVKRFRPPMYSILLICPQTHSREATTQHIEMTLPKDVPHKITGLASVEEAHEMIGGHEPVLFTHIVLNLGSADDIVSLINQIVDSSSLPNTSIVVLSDPVQRQEVIKRATTHDYNNLAKENRLTFIYKPVKPSRFAVIFDPDNERDLSTDRNRFSAQQQVANQRQNYLDIGKRLGNKGHRILLVEDNATNQKVLLKFLSKVGIAVDLAMDGVECTEKLFEQPHDFYSLILCDLHMPNKDGYTACREIRDWERKDNLPRMPIIALSANVMADVLDKCIDAGFSNYITKPVDFKALSTVMGDLLDPGGERKGEGGEAVGGATA